MNSHQYFLMRFTLIFLTFFLGISCGRNTYNAVYPTLTDGKYDSEFPYRSCSKQIEEVLKSVKKVITHAEYLSYVFEEEKKITINKLNQEILDKYSIKKEFSNENKSSTGTIIYKDEVKIALLTCAHALSFPDTIITYYEPLYVGAEKYIYSISFKQTQKNYVIGVPVSSDLEILAINIKEDIAIIGGELDKSDLPKSVFVFSYPYGSSKELEWGSFVYIIGFPKGYQMITRGIVSSPNYDKSGSYLVDALFNEGFSGGIVLAIRDGVPNFEFAGMAKSVSASYEYFLTPERKETGNVYNPNIPYTGEPFVYRFKDIDYGITHIVSTENIRSFIKQNKNYFLDKGFDFDSFIKVKSGE